LRTTTPSSERRRRALATAGAAACLLLGGCTTSRPTSEFFELSPETPAHRAAETRYFETENATELLSASAAVLQDLGFHIEESARDVGLLRAAKERSAREYGQEIERFFVLLLSFGKMLMPIDLHQQIAATVVLRPVDETGRRQEVRIMFYRVVWQGDGQSDKTYLPPGGQSMQMVRDPAIYQQFFAKLSKAVFLEAYTL
jgi:hypothetical protein